MGIDIRGEAPERDDPAEMKRLAARRRFLVGGAAVAPIIVTMSRVPAFGQQQVGFSVCASLGGEYTPQTANSGICA